MSNREYLQSLTSTEEVVDFLIRTNAGCIPGTPECLSDKYKGKDGCKQCRCDWWEREYDPTYKFR